VVFLGPFVREVVFVIHNRILIVWGYVGFENEIWLILLWGIGHFFSHHLFNQGDQIPTSRGKFQAQV
jgi:hypothetical protein